MARNKTKPKGRTRRSVEAPHEVPCGFCGAAVLIESVKFKRYRWLAGQSNFFCTLSCHHKYRIGKENPSAVVTMTGNKYNLGKSPKNKHRLDNPDFFKEIDTEPKAYYLGLLYADGSVVYDTERAVYRLALNLIDREPVLRLKELLGTSAPVVERKYEPWPNAQHCLVVCDKSMIEDLVGQGVVQNKTNILRFPEKVPEHLLRHFIRGYMDGDGHVSFLDEGDRKTLVVSFYGTRHLVSGCVNHLYNKLGLRSHGTYEQKTLTRFSRSQLQANKILDYLYKDCSHYFDRKYQKYCQWIHHRSEEGLRFIGDLSQPKQLAGEDY